MAPSSFVPSVNEGTETFKGMQLLFPYPLTLVAQTQQCTPLILSLSPLVTTFVATDKICKELGPKGTRHV